MADQTWREVVLADWQAAGAAVNAALSAAGLAPLTAWLCGEPVQLPQTGAPLAWFEWPDEGVEEMQDLLADETPRCHMICALLLEAPTPADLMLADARYEPRVVAALESYPWTYQTFYQGNARLVAARARSQVRAMVWQITACRGHGAVS